VGFDQKRKFTFKTAGQIFPDLHVQNQAKMADRDAVPVDRVNLHLATGLWCKMGDDLVAKEIEIHPCIAAASLVAAEQSTIKGPCGTKVVHGKGKVKGWR
jgi:hypothetical protein